jgi:RNA ligase partner protein
MLDDKRQKMEKYVLDTNLFFNMEAELGLGKKTEEVVIKITEMAKKIKKEKKAEIFMPPSAMAEFLSFFKDKKQPFIEDFLSAITIKSPDYGANTFPAQAFYQLIDEIRQRSYRGLNIGEEEIEKAGRLMMGAKNLNSRQFQETIGGIIKKFRERYRQATRFGFIDSVADLDLIVLAKEINGCLVSTDEGVVRWGRVFGVREMPVGVWRRRLAALLSVPHRE